jgi:hypothetical protein
MPGALAHLAGIKGVRQTVATGSRARQEDLPTIVTAKEETYDDE